MTHIDVIFEGYNIVIPDGFCLQAKAILGEFVKIGMEENSYTVFFQYFILR